jgi:archaemetzincin
MDGGMLLLEWIGAGPPDEAIWDRVRRHLEATFEMPTAFRVVDGMPADTLDARRGQRSSTKILRWILERAPADAGKVLGLTDADLFIPVLTFVFGEAQLGGVAAVVSTARLGTRYDGTPASPDLLEARYTKECLHEVGHTFGLVHCPDPMCVMVRSNALPDVDRKRAGFCRSCRQRLRNRLAERNQT